MSRAINRLTVRQVDALKAPGRHSDGGGLYLRITPQGARAWVFMSAVGGKRAEIGLGAATAVSLAQARRVAERMREALATGQDPRQAIAPPAEAAAPVPTVPTFGDFSTDLFESLSDGWRNAKHKWQWVHSLRDHASALLDKRVDAITTVDVVGALRPIWSTKPETASRVRGRIERVLSAAKVAGHRSGENPAIWRGHLDQLLPARKKLTRGHQRAMPYTDIPAFMTRLRERSATAARALEFLILNANRTSEVIGARFDEIEGTIWTVPAIRTKMGVPHDVVLCARSSEIVAEMSTIGGPYLFGGEKPLSNMAMTMLLRRMGVDDCTVHGFRSGFKDWALNETEFPDELSEEALAHLVGSSVRRAYRRGVALERRRNLMEAWERFLLAK